MIGSLPVLFLADLQELFLIVLGPVALQIAYLAVGISIVAAMLQPVLSLGRWLRWRWDNWRAARGGRY